MKKNFDVGNYIKKKNHYDRLKANNLMRIRAKLKDTINLSEFCEETRDIWDKKFYDIIEKLINNVFNLLESGEFFLEKAEDCLESSIYSKELSFKLLNLSIFMLNVGCNFEIESKILFKYS